MKRAGLTLAELMVAVGLASILMVAVFRLLDTSLHLWSRGEVQRGLVEQSSAVANLLGRDLRGLYNGQQGDFLAEWVPFDVDGDGSRDCVWPRLRLVRQASAGEIAILDQRRRRAEGAPESPVFAPDGTPVPPEPIAHSGLIEIVWAVLPAGKGAPYEGVLWRGEKLLTEITERSYLAPSFFDSIHRPPVGELNEVSGGLLWLGMQFATQTSIVHDGWKIGYDLQDAAGSWDAWNRGRPDSTYHEWNEPGAGMPGTADVPLLPRRVRLELEFERPQDVRRRTRTLDALEATTTSFLVENGDRLPDRTGAHILVGSEWMAIMSKSGDRVQVQRGRRGTAPVIHSAGKRVHFGAPVVTEVRVALYNDDWNL